jgi:hypothetical protein
MCKTSFMFIKKSDDLKILSFCILSLIITRISIPLWCDWNFGLNY